MKREHRFDVNQRAIEHSILHNVSGAFFEALRVRFQDEVARLETRIEKLQQYLTRQNRKDHRLELAEKRRLLAVYQDELNKIETLLGS